MRERFAVGHEDRRALPSGNDETNEAILWTVVCHEPISVLAVVNLSIQIE